MTWRDNFIEEQKVFISMLQDQIKERNQQLKVERANRLQLESDNRRMWELLYGVESNRNYREGSE
ncbi:hypothetical protein CSV71_14895 [Sporosarcina sp. P21c]|uniref:hypothetical protein n=1 Tax=Sporosarcina sp. P21c TaxID=2048255 RepID=UPI000C172E7F|nr:hypothetical protein [Sporosarcina sp. P21c]PIC88411.1 hypothetical protein CSV71_14895 [Sporosarcina sp. P21c]